MARPADITVDREKRLVDRMRARLESGYWPRVHCAILVSLSAAAAFLTSFVLMHLHVHRLAIRYGAAAMAGYATFLLLLQAWVRWRWSRVRLNAAGDDVVDIGSNLDIPVPSLSGTDGAHFAAGGGRSGGAGAAGSWGSPATAASKSGGGGLDVDGDDLFWVIVAAAAAFGGAIAIGYVIYIAPTLIAEVALHGAVAGKVVQGMQKRDDSFWTEQIFKRTIAPGLMVIVCATVAGYAFNRIAPDASSIAAVWAHVRL